MGGCKAAIGIAALVAAASAHAAGSANVAALQVALRAKGAYAGPVDGVLGKGTRKGVATFQQQVGLEADGIAGPRTRAALGPLGRHELGSRVLRIGRRGADVAAFQFMLAAHGAPCGPFDGVFGPRTEAALRRFERGVGLERDGIAGPHVVSLLRGPVPRVPIQLAQPVVGTLTDVFGPRGAGFHPGLDFGTAFGSPVSAAAAGRVTFAGWHAGGYGFLVVIAHGGGVRTLYAHLSSITVSLGSKVRVGSPVGLVGSTGESTGPHLHFEVRVRGLSADPMPALPR